ncbi:endonuclease/exonuclease/phosphatase family protein [Pseudalkalibacillus decolorationis]|uniref:endonuclease/exonuclease/phosphatase family protein n=1 Tax=Pseudalkalibacillus decolorationis TaxID=163879 RepID=UPI002148B206|nr:endonuclease/exonuclease/phosphatase family protein [Pseudalkalibacillus decolorationis]
MDLKILTFNIHHGKGMDKKLDLKRISQIIDESNADIIGLNEVDKQFSKRSEYMDQAEWIANKLKMDYVFGPAITMEGKRKDDIRQYGSTILTRFPILDSENHPFDFLPSIIEDRSLLEVTLEIDKQEVAVYVTHLSLAPFLHGKQTEFILKQVNKQKTPSIIMGDWNMKPYSSSWRLITKQLKDTWVEHQTKGDCGYTYPSNRPRMKLDYIFTNKEFEVINSKVLIHEKEASDHLPLLTTLKLK